MAGSARPHSWQKAVSQSDEPRIAVSAHANAQIAVAYEWYENRVPGLGVDFIRRVDTTLLLIQPK